MPACPRHPLQQGQQQQKQDPSAQQHALQKTSSLVGGQQGATQQQQQAGASPQAKPSSTLAQQSQSQQQQSQLQTQQQPRQQRQGSFDVDALLGALAPLGGGIMSSISPFQGLVGHLVPEFAQQLQSLAQAQQRLMAELPRRMLLDVSEDDHAVTYVADVPGATLNDIKVDVDANGLLSISSHKEARQERDEDQGGGRVVHTTERTSGKQWRQVQLPHYVDANKVSAKLDNGVLTLTAPKTGGAQGRRSVPISQA